MRKILIRAFPCQSGKSLRLMKTGAEQTRLLAMWLLVGLSLSISGCMGLTSAPNSSSRKNPSDPGTLAAISVSPPSIAFGSVAVGSTVSQSITLTNTGRSNLSVTQDSIAVQGFTLTGMSLPMTIGAGKQSMMNVVFSPKAAGSASGTVSVMSNASKSPATVTVSGTGVSAAASLNFSSTSLDFERVPRGKESVLSVILTNTGNSDVSINKVTVSGARFTTSGVSAGMILAPNQTATLDVTFAPTAAGDQAGSIVVSSNATNSPTTISLSGSGAHGHSKSTTLNWTASTSAVAGYNVYRSTVSGGPYTKLNSSIITSTSYTDYTTKSHEVYYYVVTSVAATQESSGSNQAAANIPGD